MTSIILPETLETIRQEAFSFNNLTSITIPSSILSIENDSFYGNGISGNIYKSLPTPFAGTWNLIINDWVKQ